VSIANPLRGFAKRGYRVASHKMKTQIAKNSAATICHLEDETFNDTTAIAALLFLAERFPHRQFNTTELAIISGIGRTAMSQIKNASDTPFSLGKCTMRRLDDWLRAHPGFKQN
jgi:hypothetical protein